MKKFYLLTYNLLLAIGWCIFLLREIINGFSLDSISLMLLNVVQLAAVLEIIHAALRWVSSPVFTTVLQVASRLFVLIFINILPPEQQISIAGVSGVMMITLAWGITEIIRYSFYFSSLLNKDLHPLTFMRYTFFIGLYPLGVFGEWLILLSVLRATHWSFSPLNIFIIVVLLSYLPFFPKLYLYMWQQRKKKLA